jgi:hypothetical protein
MTIVLDDSAIGPDISPIDYCVSVVLKEAKQEDRLVRQLMYVMLSAYTNNPLNLGINSPSGEGKNWVLEKVSEKFPKEDVQSLSGMTEKALFHKKGVLVIRNDEGKYEFVDTLVSDIDDAIKEKEYEIASSQDSTLINAHENSIQDLKEEKKDIYRNAMKLIDLNHKILIFLDTPPMGLLSALMSLLAHDKYEAEYEYADTSNGITTKTNILRGWPVAIYAQAIDYSKYERWAEVQRRFIITNPQMDSKEKYSQAVDLAIDKFGLPDFVYQKVVSSDEEKDRVREVIKMQKEEILNISTVLAPGKNPTFVPFHETVKSGLPKDKSQEMNSGKRFGIILSLLGMINIERRPRIKLVTKGDPIIKIVPLILFEDLKESISLMEYANGVRPYVLEWFYRVFEQMYYTKTEVDSKVKVFNKGNQVVYEDRIAVTTPDLIAATKDVAGKAYTSSHILHTFIYPLINQGYIDSEESQLDHRAHIYFPVVIDEKRRGEHVTSNKNIELIKWTDFNNFLQSGKMHIRDITTFPNKVYLMSRIQWFLKYCEDDAVLATIYDHEDKEMSIEELIDRYYQNPESYFDTDSNNKFTGSDQDSSNNTFETVKIGSSHKETTTNMQELDSPDVDDCKKLLKTDHFNNSILFSSGTAAMSKNDINMSNDHGIWSCAYCIISNRIEDTNKVTGFRTLSDYQKHIMKSHRNLANQKSLTFDPEPLDLEKFESEFIAEKQKQNKSKSKVTEMAEANESGNGVMFHGNGEVKKSKLAEMTEANESGKGVLFEGNEKGAT